ncbi:MAG TPA: glycolate oxidase subunit GlcE [Xanthobacteraceae bacterium]|jgi:glycolate oxidase FAD binding subunit|nr:glycolate oxidase subunit GlcE [Xanthobacteraceae bacterium]
MSDIFKPRDDKDLEAIIQAALSRDTVLEVIGAGTKRTIGRPVQAGATLDISGLSGVTLYEPNELVLTARAGTPLAVIEEAIAATGQQLAFEPIDYAAVLGTPRGAATLGGVLACNLSGPRRLCAGAARDHFLGFSAVSGRGETFKSGGRVVKNVTGYDLCKLMAGSWGTLAVMTDVTIKVLPRPETEETVLALGLAPADAVKAMTAIMGSRCEASGAAHLPAHVALRTTAGKHHAPVTAIRIDGVAPSVAHRVREAREILGVFAPDGATLSGTASTEFWTAVRHVLPFAATGKAERPLWRISVPPSAAAKVADDICGALGGEAMWDWAGGLIWIECLPVENAGAGIVRRAIREAGGHATLIRAPAALRATVDVFQDDAAPVAALSRRIKQGFDPKGVLNPGRMWAGV